MSLYSNDNKGSVKTKNKLFGTLAILGIILVIPFAIYSCGKATEDTTPVLDGKTQVEIEVDEETAEEWGDINLQKTYDENDTELEPIAD